ncbi:MAG: hypothetical protein ACLP3C_25225 [Mycobacterium sp.]|uniref:hypothetical protein n=1 Tax=Mycobacterium sp. TaxID=1785 RepID=UPI003C329EF0
MTVGIEMPNVFDAGLPTLSYDITESPHDVYPMVPDPRELPAGPTGAAQIGVVLKPYHPS